jgi:acyl-CoA synthetase (NDP forming)
MLEMLKGAETRIVGPNCLGIHCTESRVIYDPVFVQKAPGEVGLLSQSGGLTNNILRLAQARHIPINKAVSYGNQIDISVEDFLEYFSRDRRITAIAAYIEDAKDARRFLNVLGKAAIQKPVVILKGGVTEQGIRATASHTAALALDPRIWSAALRQHRAIEVRTIEEMLDVIQLGIAERLPRGKRIAFVTAGGGASVLFTDLANMHGLVLPELEEDTKARIREQISEVNTSINNPVDLGASGFNFDIVTESIKALDEDGGIDAIIPFFCLDFINSFLSDQLESAPRRFLETAINLKKPVIPVLTNYSESDFQVEKTRYRIYALFRGAGLPVYSTIQDAASAMHRILTWRL